MQVNITREVILDLVPVYLAGDASSDTKKIVEEFAATDTQVASILSVGELELQSQTHQLPDLEMETLKHTRRRVSRQAWNKALAIVSTILIASLGWFATFLAIIFWVFYFINRDKLKDMLFPKVP